jgi:NitT/TauT family transport system ATP-binding protein
VTATTDHHGQPAVKKVTKAPAAAASANARPSHGGPAISVKNLSKTYTTRRGPVEAVRDSSFDVKDGEFVALVGPSGCGKSTILQIVAGLIPYDDGTVHVAGNEAKPGRREVGIMFQAAVLLPWRTVLENVLLPMEVFGLDNAQAKERAHELLDVVGLQGFDDKYPWELSGGMQQRASLARILVYEPEILLMDEPFAALDEFTRERLNVELASIHETYGRSVLYVTHNIQEAVLLSDRVVVMKPHPGEILDIIETKLPRPRSLDVLLEPKTAELAAGIRRMLYTDEIGASGDGQ